MITNYFTIACRNLLRNKVFSFINILGLAVGMAACFLIVQYVHFELSYDKYHDHADRIYRVIVEGGTRDIATNHPGAGPALEKDFPEVEAFTRVVHQGIFASGVTSWSFADENNQLRVFNEERVFNVDPNFFYFFSHRFVYGNAETAFPDRSSVVITESTARKYFGDQSPVGKILVRDGGRAFTIRGVVEDVPPNSHLQFDILVSYFMTDAWGDGWDHSWDWKWQEYFTYVRLSPGIGKESLEAKLRAFTKTYLGDLMEQSGKQYTLRLQALTDIHLTSSHLAKEPEVRGNKQSVYFLTIIATLILIVAWINYVNLSTAKSVDRSREVGIRKVAGASKRQLIIQFLLESAVINLLAVAVSIFFVILALPYFNEFTGKEIGTSISELRLLQEEWFWIALVAIYVLASFSSGLYPAFAMSSFRITTVLKGKFFGTRSGTNLRKALVGFQFAISVALIAGTIIVVRQLSFMRSHDPGYAKNQLLVVKSPRILDFDSTFFTRVESFKTELFRIPDVHSVTATSEVPGKLIPQMNGLRNLDEGVDQNIFVYHFYIDTDFQPTYEIDVLAGRNFNTDERLYWDGLRAEREEQGIAVPIIVNEKAAKDLGYASASEAINQRVRFGLGTRDWVGEIVGVFGNHHQQSLQGGYDPILFFPSPNSIGQYLTFNIEINQPGKTIAGIERQFTTFFPGNAFEFFFLDDYFNRQYSDDQQFGNVFGLFSGLALVVAALGLFGLSTFMISQRTKEIAVRKILGATISSMVVLFYRDFFRLILIANLIALPVVYFLAERWLSGYAFRTGTGWLMFAAPAIVLLIISLATVGMQTIKTGLTNPVKSLRSE